MIDSTSLTHTAAVIAGVIAWWILILLPGSWVTFGFKTDALPFGMKALGGMMLSPFIVLIQFYILGLAGVPFALTAYLLAILNLPASILIFRRRVEVRVPRRNEVLAAGFIMALCALSLAPYLLSVESRVFSGHAWTHADIIYQLSNGALWPEEPELAGISLAYPWGGHVFQAIQSYFINSAPVSSYIWTNLVWALCTGACIGYVVSEIGGNRFAKLTAPLWLFFGLNWLGYLLQQILPTAIVDKFWIGGDYRYTPWILKFFFFEQIVYGLGMMAVLIYITLRRFSSADSRYPAALTFILLTGIGILYPICIVPAAFVVFSGIVVSHLNSKRLDSSPAQQQNVALSIALAASGLITLAHLKLVTVERVTSAIQWPALTRYFASYTVLKSQGTIVAISVLAAAYLFVLLRERKSPTVPKLLVLGVGSLLIVLVNIVVELPFFGNEYKFILVVALCLSPFAAVALGSTIGRSTYVKILVGGVLVVALYAPFAHKLTRDYPFRQKNSESQSSAVEIPSVNVESFALKLSEHEEMFEICEAVKLETPVDSVIVIEATPLHLPSVTQRSLFVSPSYEGKRAGVNLSSGELLTDVRGYDEKLFSDRKTVLSNLYKSRDEEEIRDSLRTIMSLNRPAAIVLEPEHHVVLRDWLIKNHVGSPLLTVRRMELWILRPDEELN